MKGILHALGRTMSSRTFHVVFLIALLLGSFGLQAKTVIIGSGSGRVSQSNMTGLVPGDVLSINPGTYTSGSFSSLNGITITNNGGLVVFTGTVYYANNTSVIWDGTGASGTKYGFQFTGFSNQNGCFALDGHIEKSTWKNIEFVNVDADAFGNQNYQTFYDGYNDNTKRLLNCTITNIRMDHAVAFMTNFRPLFANVVDGCDFNNVIVDNQKTVKLLAVNNFYRSKIHNWTIGQQICPIPLDNQGHTLDQGNFEFVGSVDVYDCTEHGFNWGWFLRIIQQGLNQRDDCHIYNNIRVGSSNYGFVDFRQDASGYLNPLKPYVRGGDMYITNNTCGNMITTNNYLTVVCVAYNFPGQHLYVQNNLRFNAKNLNSTPDSANVVHYGSPLDNVTESNNKYFADAISAGALSDTVTCTLKANSPAIDKGMAVSYVTNDFAGVSRPQGAAYDIGAREWDQNTPPPAPNKSPIAVGDPLQTITLPSNKVTVNGSNSSDPDGNIASYGWSEVSGPSSTIGNAGNASTSVSGLTAGTYIFQLKVTDNGGASATVLDTVIVKPSPNQAPVADAGKGSNLVLPNNTVSLDGSASTDPDNNITSYSWKQVSGPSAATITNAGTKIASATNLVAGQYIFQITVTDAEGLTSQATVKITVVAAGLQPPSANAGSDKTITLPTNSVNLNGDASIATSGGIVAYTWSQASGPAGATLPSADQSSTTAGSLVAGVYVFKLTVKDSAGAADTDSVTVTVNAAVNKAPTANAGIEQTITLPTNSVTLDGTGSSDPDGTIASYSWKKISGPGAISLGNSTSSKATPSGLQAGSYTFQLTVTDNSGASATDQVVITVNPAAKAPNQSPIANAGNNTTITLPTSSVQLDGTSSFDPDGNIATYSWSLVSGPGGSSLSPSNSATPNVSGLKAGTYVFKLTVADNSGSSASDQVTITVNAAATTTPPTTPPTTTPPTTTPPPTTPPTTTPPTTTPPTTTPPTTTPPTTTPPTTTPPTTTPPTTTPPSTPALVRGTPVAVAGNDTTISLPDNSLMLDGSNSTDVGGSIAAYSWTELDGPNSVSMSSFSSPTTLATGLEEGVYDFKLSVTDASGNTSYSVVKVTVVKGKYIADALTLYPNPAHDIMNVRLVSALTGNLVATVYDVSGKLVYQVQLDKEGELIDKQFDVSTLAKGMYMLHINLSNKKSMVSKFVKE